MTMNMRYASQEEWDWICAQKEEREVLIKINETCTFMIDFGKKLNLQQPVIATSLIFFHRFFLSRPPIDSDLFLYGAACVYTGAKVEDTPRKLESAIQCFIALRQKKATGVTSTAGGNVQPAIELTHKQKNRLKHQFIELEMMILTEIGASSLFLFRHPKCLFSSLSPFRA
eukprot:CAMPEP_0115009950 /NCGR_PEP_ID=MMETSP0216-20121206/22974_1 /TAXON_ID=223996 /ORGANISM="Protocruzia adherens, Strain Boccale" /LENGTH=170 /DNA_ID=CAMNT_0002377969 /DNA_START=254 /DNA_END=766 /DNA_ORIENTATION=+